MPSACTLSISGVRPRGNLTGSGVQSPSPARSLLRPANQPSSTTKHSTPICAASSARPAWPSSLTANPVASQELYSTGRSSGWPAAAAGASGAVGAVGRADAVGAVARADAAGEADAVGGAGAGQPGRATAVRSPRPSTWARCHACHSRLAAPNPPPEYRPANTGSTSFSPGASSCARSKSFQPPQACTRPAGVVSQTIFHEPLHASAALHTSPVVSVDAPSGSSVNHG